VGWLGLGLRLVGRIGSGVRVSVSFLQKYPPGSVLRCPTAAENGGYDQGGWVRGVTSSRACNVEPVTNTSSSSCANNGTSDAAVCSTLAAVRRGFVLHSSRLLRLTTLWTCMQRSQIFVQNRVFAYPTCIRRPRLGGFPSEYRHTVSHGKLEWLGYPVVKKLKKIYLFVMTQLTNVTDTQTQTHRMTA